MHRHCGPSRPMTKIPSLKRSDQIAAGNGFTAFGRRDPFLFGMFREGTVSFREGNTIRVLETKQLLPACDLLKAQQSGG